MKINSKILCILAAVAVIAMVISAVNAVDLVKNDFNNENFAIDIPSGSDFSEEVTTNINAGDVAMNMLVFENSGNNSDDVSAVIYLKDSSPDKNVISDFTNDLQKDGEIVEENDGYVIVKTQNSNNLFNFDVGNDLDSIFSFFDGLFSSDGNINISDNGDGISFSDGVLEIHDANGENVSISADGIKVSGEASSEDGNVSDVTDVSVEGNMTDIHYGEYVLYLENPDNNQLIAISGNNLDVMKAMADTASFKWINFYLILFFIFLAGFFTNYITFSFYTIN